MSTPDGSPLVSILMPTRNRLGHLRESLENTLAQTETNREIIISDNHSTDGTALYLATMASRHPEIRVIRPPAPVGLYENHNLCLEHARGRFVSFFQDHDLHDPDFLKTCLTFLEGHPQAGFAGTGWRLIDEEGRVLGIRRERSHRLTGGAQFIDRTLREGRSPVAMAGALIRREALGDIRLGGALGFGDFLMWFRMAETWKVGILGRVAWSWRQSRDAGSRVPISQMVSDYQTNMNTYLKEVVLRRPEWKSRVKEWKKKSTRFCRWALIYEIIHQNLAGLPGTPGTLFQMYGYRLGQADLARVEKNLRSLGLTWMEKTVLHTGTWLAKNRIFRLFPGYLLARPWFCRRLILR